jgi:hypothetical protein
MTVALKNVGEALYGEHWMGRMADDLGVSDRSLRRWANGSVEIPQGVWEDLLELMRFRREALDDKICQVVADFLPKSKISAI